MPRPSVRNAGFTLIELLIAIAIVAILTGIAVPSFSDYVRRGRIVEALTRLADHRVRMEQFFLDNRRYDDDAGNCGYPAPRAAAGDAFSLQCSATTSAYLITATGVAGKNVGGFVFAIDEANVHRTAAVPDGWVTSASCWVVRRDGTCL